MIILYTTPTNKSIGINHPNQTREQRQYNLSHELLLECEFIPDITYHIEYNTGDFVDSFDNWESIHANYPHIK